MSKLNKSQIESIRNDARLDASKGGTGYLNHLKERVKNLKESLEINTEILEVYLEEFEKGANGKTKEVK